MRVMSSALTDLFPYPIVQAPMAGGVSVPAARRRRVRGRRARVPRRRVQDRRRRCTRRSSSCAGSPAGPSASTSSCRSPSTPTRPPSRSTRTSSPARPPGTRPSSATRTAAATTATRPSSPSCSTTRCRSSPSPSAAPPATSSTPCAAAGTFTVVTATTAEEAQAAQWAGADAVCVQGVEAGGHQGTHRDDPRDRRLRHRAALAGRPGPRDRAAADRRRRRHHARRPDRRRARGGRERRAARHGVPRLPRVRRQRRCTSRRMTNPLFVRTELTRAFSGRPGPRPGQPLHARARAVRARRLPRGPPPHRRRCARPPPRRGTRRAWRCGRGRATGWRASCPPGSWSRCWPPNWPPRRPRCRRAGGRVR